MVKKWARTSIYAYYYFDILQIVNIRTKYISKENYLNYTEKRMFACRVFLVIDIFLVIK